MKNHLMKGAFKSLVLILLVSISSSLFAISFYEQRKVIIPKYSNAVYRGLGVLDRMYWTQPNKFEDLDYKIPEGSRLFMLEIGKRPTYFWTEGTENDQMFHLFQNVELDLAQAGYRGLKGQVNNQLNIETMQLDNGSFYSEGLFLYKDSVVTLKNSTSNLFINYTGDFIIDLEFGTEPKDYQIFAQNIRFWLGQEGLLNTSTKLKELYIRDLFFEYGKTGVIFPSRRMMIYKNGSNYIAQGTAIDFYPSPANISSTKNYYGEWELHNKSNICRANDSSCDPCVNRDVRCYKVVNNRSVPDRDTSVFECAGIPEDGISTTYDPGDYDGGTTFCYDYQVKSLPYDTANTEAFNNNKSSYEFKVEEVYDLNDSTSTATFLSQTPNTIRVASSSSDEIRQLSIYNSSSHQWGLNTYFNNNSFRVIINGSPYTFTQGIDVLTDAAQADNPCFYLCDGKLCEHNRLYIKNKTQRELKSADLMHMSYWPAAEGHKQHLVLWTYTLGFCPKINASSERPLYELNYNSSQHSNFIDALLIKDGDGNWVAPKVCMRRKVMCNKLTGTGYRRTFKLLSTDY